MAENTQFVNRNQNLPENNQKAPGIQIISDGNQYSVNRNPNILASIQKQLPGQIVPGSSQYLVRNQNLPGQGPGRQQQALQLQSNNKVPQYHLNQNLPNQGQGHVVQISQIPVSNITVTTGQILPKNMNSNQQNEIQGNQNIQYRQKLLGNIQQSQQQHTYVDIPYQQNQQGQKLSGNQGNAGDQVNVNIALQNQNSLPGNQRHQMTLNSPLEGQGHVNDQCSEVVEIEDDDIPHIQQVHGSCVLCGKFSLYLCSTCKNVWYCSPACQNNHWESHSAECRAEGT